MRMHNATKRRFHSLNSLHSITIASYLQAKPPKIAHYFSNPRINVLPTTENMTNSSNQNIIFSIFDIDFFGKVCYNGIIGIKFCNSRYHF